MQHYGLPTRLLDWTESALTALYFATYDPYEGKEGRTGKLYILNAPKLNHITTGYPHLMKPTDFLKKIKHLLILPVAVSPSHINDRIKLQAGTFILFGGSHRINSPFPKPVSLEEINSEEHIYIEVEIPGKKKDFILRQLQALGIHKASLFPELEHQASYIKELWRDNRE